MISLEIEAEKKKDLIYKILRAIKEILKEKEPTISARADALLQMPNGIHVFAWLSVQTSSILDSIIDSHFEHLQKMLFLLSEEAWKKIRLFDSAFNADVNIEISKLIFDINSKVEKIRQKDALNFYRDHYNFAQARHLAGPIEKLNKKEKNLLIERYISEKEPELDNAKRSRFCAVCRSIAVSVCCFDTAYCSSHCQTVDWSTHQLVCNHETFVIKCQNDNS